VVGWYANMSCQVVGRFGRAILVDEGRFFVQRVMPSVLRDKRTHKMIGKKDSAR